MKRSILFLLLLINVNLTVFTLSNGESYYLVETWFVGKNAGGEIKVRLKIIEIMSDSILVEIQKEMTPFSPVINNKTIAKYNGGKYIFEFNDNWDNNVFGSFSVEKEKIVFFIDCKEYSESGRNLARFYGATHILTKVNISYGWIDRGQTRFR